MWLKNFRAGEEVTKSHQELFDDANAKAVLVLRSVSDSTFTLTE
jgi:hypothetical protein